MIVLVGFMGSGKTAVGRALAQKVGLPFVDTDRVIEDRAGAPIADVFASGGESAFREIERDVVAEVLSGPDAVVALGGGALGDPTTCAALEWATVVHLEVAYPEAMKRIGADPGRPMLAISDPKALFSERLPVYRRVADLSVATDGRSEDEIADDIAGRTEKPPPDEAPYRSVPVPIAGHPYEVLIGSGLAARTGELAPVLDDAEIAVVVTHPTLRHLADPVAASLEERGLRVRFAEVPEGERSKSLEVAGGLYDALARAGAHRRDLVVAVGGGVICDLAGFVASTYHRGMPVINVATTLLAQVDAAIGGKTGVNLTHGKNLVGTIHQPACVICDVDALRELPDEEFRSGLAEVVKYGLIAAPDLLTVIETKADELFARVPDLLIEVVARAAAIKARVVAGDEREEGARAHLNYGHTFGHALEQAAGFEGIRHGEAISLGMMAVAYLARELGRIDDDAVELHRRALSAAGLPTTATLDIGALEGAWQHDKKYVGEVRFVLLSAIGRPEAGITAPRDAIERALKRMA